MDGAKSTGINSAGGPGEWRRLVQHIQIVLEEAGWDSDHEWSPWALVALPLAMSPWEGGQQAPALYITQQPNSVLVPLLSP